MMVMERFKSTADNCLRIFTLGRFEVYRNDVQLSQLASRSSRVWDLFKYLLTYRDRSSTPEAIIETLWPQHNYADMRKALRTPIYRLRQILQNDSDEQYILFSQGCYIWNNQAHYWLDTDEFENLIKTAQTSEADPETLIDLYLRAINLYHGEYLPENLYADWTITQRNYYRRLFLEAVDALAGLYKAQQRHHEIINLCEKAIALEPFEEILHNHYLESLINTGRHKQAKEHYQQITQLFYTELGVKPSPKLQQLYRQLQNKTGQQQLEEQPLDAAFYCTPEIFASICNLERRRGERTKQPAVIGKLTLVTENAHLLSAGLADNVVEILLKILRKGDVVTKNSNDRLQILFSNLDLQQAKVVISRIEKQLKPKIPQGCHLTIETELLSAKS